MLNSRLRWNLFIEMCAHIQNNGTKIRVFDCNSKNICGIVFLVKPAMFLVLFHDAQTLRPSCLGVPNTSAIVFLSPKYFGHRDHEDFLSNALYNIYVNG